MLITYEEENNFDEFFDTVESQSGLPERRSH